MKVSLDKVEELVAKACEGVSEKLAKEVTIWLVGRPEKALERSYEEGLVDESATKLSGIMLRRPRTGRLLDDALGLARDLYEHRVPFHPESCMGRGPEGIEVTFPGRAPARGVVWTPASKARWFAQMTKYSPVFRSLSKAEQEEVYAFNERERIAKRSKSGEDLGEDPMDRFTRRHAEAGPGKAG